jgi:ribonuclease Z
MPVHGRFTACQLVEIQNEHFLVDCGEGAQMQLHRFQHSIHRINHILISHLHGDHFLGLLGLLFSMHMNKRTNDLHLYSHRGLEEILTVQLKHSRSVPQFRIVFHPLQAEHPEVIFENKHVTIETIPLLHKIECTGFLFKEKEKPYRINKETLPEGLLIQQLAALKRGEDVVDDAGNILYTHQSLTLPPRHARSYAYCSDTHYHEPLIEQLRGIDVLYHEATFMEEEKSKAWETKHSTATQAATIAKKSSVGKLLIGHFSARYRELDPLLQEARVVFPNTFLAEEGKTFQIDE